jgi:hypothetical protein
MLSLIINLLAAVLGCGICAWILWRPLKQENRRFPVESSTPVEHDDD